jgi:hypothetical protein
VLALAVTAIALVFSALLAIGALTLSYSGWISSGSGTGVTASGDAFGARSIAAAVVMVIALGASVALVNGADPLWRARWGTIAAVCCIMLAAGTMFLFVIKMGLAPNYTLRDVLQLMGASIVWVFFGIVFATISNGDGLLRAWPYVFGMIGLFHLLMFFNPAALRLDTLFVGRIAVLAVLGLMAAAFEYARALLSAAKA